MTPEIGLGSKDVKAHVEMGVCRFSCDIKAYPVDGKIRCEIFTNCQAVKEFGMSLPDLDPFATLKMPYCDNEIFELAGKLLKHVSCPVPIAIVKCVEVASGLALARNVTIEFNA
jgi:hypothetical protein